MEADDIRFDDSASQAGSNSSSSRRATLEARRAALVAEGQFIEEELTLQMQELKIKQQLEKIRYQRQLAAVTAEAAAFADAEGQVDQPVIADAPRSDHVSPDPDITFRSHTATSPIDMLGVLRSSQVQQQHLLDVIRLPTSHCLSYNGDPLQYWSFIRSFDNSVGNSLLDDGEKLIRLLQACSGRAKRIVECCAVMEPSQGYFRARELLRQRCGDDFLIAEAWVNKVTTNRGKLLNNKDKLEEFADELTCCEETLKSMGYIDELNSQSTLLRIIEQLPVFYQTRFKREVRQIRERFSRNPNISDIVRFVREISLEINDPVYGRLGYENKRTDNREFTNKRVHTLASAQSTSDRESSPNSNCRLCRQNHTLFQCPMFKAKNVSERSQFAKANRLCFNCLHPGHNAFNCKVNRTCSVPGCGKKHTKFLHETPGSTSSQVDQTRTATNTAGATIGAGQISVASLPIVLVSVYNPVTQQMCKTHALLDSGSTNSFCTKNIASRLGLRASYLTKLSLTTLDGLTVSDTAIVELNVSDASGGGRVIHLSNVYVRENLPISMASRAEDKDLFKHPHLRRIQRPFSQNEDIGLLIGQDAPDALIPLEIVRGDRTSDPYAVKTILGWVINGPVECESSNACQVTSTFTNVQLGHMVERFWKLETVGNSDLNNEPGYSINDIRAENMWKESIKLDDSGHYELPIPFKSSPLQLPNNITMARQRLEHLKKRLMNNKDMKDKYTGEVDELLCKGYAEEVFGARDNNTPTWYLPHHSVVNPKKPDKFRIVFDCSAKFNDTSLNTQVLQGPDLTNKLLGVLIRFRLERIAVTADIQSMFHQVKVCPENRDVLRFLWYKDGNLDAEPTTYRMTVHLFGGIWSPSCCNFALRQTLNDNVEDSEHRESISKCFYVDDCLSSVSESSQAINFVNTTTSVLSKGGFRLTKWMSNSHDVISAIPESELSKDIKGFNLLDEKSLPTQRVLGIKWNIEPDTLEFEVNQLGRPSTRRGILSLVSSIFDPIGFLAPFIMPAKRILQELCRINLTWDQPLPEKQLSQWNEWLEDLPKINKIQIPRCMKNYDVNEITTSQLHHFSDASQYGYGTATYLRQVDINGRVSCSLLIAKSRLAPMKQLTIPRLELSAAVLAVRMDNFIHTELPVSNPSVFWSDSTVVLSYIRNEDKRFQTFVANRLAFIHSSSKPSQWRYVNTELNPADDVSRGMRIDELLARKGWFEGPEFLHNDENEWPKDPILNTNLVDDTDPEVKKESVIYVTQQRCIDNQPDVFERIILRRSNWYDLKRDIAWILRAKERLINKIRRKPEKIMKLSLTVEEIERAELSVIKYVQDDCFGEEIRSLQSNIAIKKCSSIYRLEPMLTPDGILRVGGRLQSHPVILPRKHHVVDLIVRDCHIHNCHVGREHVMSLLRERYWIIGCRTTVRRILNDCVTCKRQRAVPVSQRMADMPESRTTPSEPFSMVGVDLFGTFYVKQGRSMVKRYGCLFTCFTIRAVHIEIVHSLNTESFINALQRFICRRGPVKHIYSDNGTNFVGAEKEISKSIENWNQDRIDGFLKQRSTQWHFNTPAASHMGGVWERQIRTVRKIINSVAKQQTLNDEALHTLMCLAEYTVNSRPITYISNDCHDLEALTPNHLLLLRSGESMTLSELSKEDVYSRKRWKQVQYLATLFWKRWQREYITTLQLRTKWTDKVNNVKVGDIVLMVDNRLPRNSWPLARVTEVFPGQDGLVRSVEIKTNSGVYLRPVQKLCLLESSSD